MKELKKEFVDNTLLKIKKVIDSVLKYHKVEMTYDIKERNELFCEIIKKTKSDLTTNNMFDKIMSTLYSESGLSKEQSEWLSEQIYIYNKDIFLLHYFYAILYSYNYDVELRERISESHIHKFFDTANGIYKKYKDLTLNE